MAKTRVNITIDQKLHDELKRVGAENCRSVSQEIEYRLLHPTSTNTITATAGYAHEPITPTPFTEVTTTTAGLSQPTYIKQETVKYPAVWLKEQKISPADKSEATFRKFNRVYPKYDYTDFIEIQANRACAYEPDPNDPFDPMANNPYNR